MLMPFSRGLHLHANMAGTLIHLLTKLHVGEKASCSAYVNPLHWFNWSFYPTVRFRPNSSHVSLLNGFRAGQDQCLASLPRWILPNQLLVNST